MRSRYRRTAGTVKHKQDPEKAARAAAVLANLIARAETGRLDLIYLDECGFAPSLPTGYSWCLPGQRKRVKYEYPQGRRVNVLATYRPIGAAPRLHAAAFERTLTSEDLLGYLRGLPAAGVPRVVVLDNAGLHVSKAVKAQRKELARRGTFLYYLPAYSPELNRIEPVFKQVKHHEIPRRSHQSKAELRASVESGFESYGRKLGPKSGQQLRPAAYIVRGEPLNAVILRRARVPEAYSVVILADDREGRHADGKSILTCIAIRDTCRAGYRPHVVAECHNPDFRSHLVKAGADEVVSSDEMGLQLVARAALFHGVTQLYQELLTVGRDANEMYLVPAPEGLIGRDFVEVNALFARHRRGIRSCLVIGVQRGEQMHLNPIDGEAGPLRPGDELIILSRAAPDPSLPLPTDPPIDSTPAIGRGTALVAEADR